MQLHHVHVCICKMMYLHINARVAFRKSRKGGGGQICEQGSFEGAGLIRVPTTLGGSGGMLPQEILKKKRHALRSSFLALHYMYNIHVSVSGLIHIIYNIYIYTVSENFWGGGGGKATKGGGGEMPPSPPP